MRSILAAALVFLAVPVHAQFTIQNSGTTASLRGIHSLGGGVAWASGTNGTVLRTEDAGYIWQKCAVPPGAEKLDFRAVQGLSANAAVVMSSGTGGESRLYKTIDGCQTWQLIFANPDANGFWDAFRLGPDQGSGKDSYVGILLGDPVREHFPLWEVNTDEFNLPITTVGDRPKSERDEAAFAASNQSLFIEWSYGRLWIGTGGKKGGRVIERRLRGLGANRSYSYRAEKVPIATGSDSAGIFALAFRPEPKVALKPISFRVGIAVGGNYEKPDESAGTAAFTLDGGRHWDAAKTMPHGYRSAVAYDAATKTWIAVGTNGTDVSTDDGENWRTVKSADGSDKNWNAISLPFAVGPNGRIGRLEESALK